MFKVGDIVIGNEKANRYVYTSEGVKCRVLNIINDNEIQVEVNVNDELRVFYVNPRCFDLVEMGSFKFALDIDAFKKLTGIGDGYRFSLSNGCYNPYRVVGNMIFDCEGDEVGIGEMLHEMDGATITVTKDDVKEMTLEEISKELGYKVKIKEN